MNRRRIFLLSVVVLLVVAEAIVLAWKSSHKPASHPLPAPAPPPLVYKPRAPMETSGYGLVISKLEPRALDASLAEISKGWQRIGYRNIERVDRELAAAKESDLSQVRAVLMKAMLWNYEGEPARAYEVLAQERSRVEANSKLAEEWLYTIIYYQGLCSLRRGENENCILCRGESSCIIPISRAAIHINPSGSRQAIQHFREYLEQFPDDLEVRWLLNVAYMTLGEHPSQVDPSYLLSLDSFFHSEFDIGKFRDVGHLVGVNRLNQAGGAIMDDFDNDGLLDIVVTAQDPTEHVVFFHNKGDGTFEDRTEAAGLMGQLGGLNCVQGDYNNDGHMEIFIPRGAWLPAEQAMRPSLLRNNGNGTFTDVTREAGLLAPLNSISASWADYDNDGFLDLFVCCEKQANRLYHNKGDGTFEEVAAQAGVQGQGRSGKGAAWIDYDNDGFPDLFLNNHGGAAQLFHNNGDGTFTEVTQAMGVTGPMHGFSCWAWDFDNDGWLDIFATSYNTTLGDVVRGMLDQPQHGQYTSKLFRNVGGERFQDVTKEAGLDRAYATMGSNFGDFDNDGYLDFYLGTGNPHLEALVPNRLFKNVGGKRFADITTSSGTGNLQKGHGVACGDWDRNGTVDIFIEMGGVTNGDKYHNILFQNPGQGNNWLSVKLVGKKTNRAAIGARIKAVTASQTPLTVCRHVSSGSSFGANPLEQHLGLGKANKVALLEIRWPTSGTTQVFRDVEVNQTIEITEFADGYRKLKHKPIPLPQ
jgi:hypothetical protein